MVSREEEALAALSELRAQVARERAAREAAEAQLRLLLDTSLIGVCTCDPTGRVLEANDAFLRILGSSREAVRDRSLDLIELTPPADRARAREARRLVVEEGELPPAEIELTRPDGKIVPVLIAGTRLPGRQAVVMFAQDLTEARRKDAAVRAAEARLSLVLETAPVRLFELDPNGAITLAAGFANLGIPTELGQTIFSRWKDRPEIGAFVRRSLAGEPVQSRVAIGERLFDTTLRPQRAHANGPVTSVLGLALEVTGEVRAAEERRLLQERLAQEHQLDGLGTLATGLAYEFNNLLAGMLANASSALQALEVGSPSRGALEDVLGAASRAAALTRQVLQTASPSPADAQPINLARRLREMAPLLAAAVPRPARLEMQVEGILPMVRSHPVQLRRVLLPLLSGAVEATREKGGLVRIAASLIELRANASGGEAKAANGEAKAASGEAKAANGESDPAASSLLGGVRLAPGWYVSVSVEDDGAPLDTATLKAGFDPLRAGIPRPRALGLAAVLGSMQAQHGGVRVGTGALGGTRVELLYPVSDAPAQTPKLQAPQGPARSREVMIVDDDPYIVRAARRLLRSIDLGAIAAENGDAALALLRDPAVAPGLVLLDFAMPGLSGEQTLRALKQARPEVRILLCSGYSREEIGWRIDPALLSGFLAKPFTAGEFQDAVRRALDGSV